MVCQTFASLFGLWILTGEAYSVLQPNLLEIPCFPLQPANATHQCIPVAHCFPGPEAPRTTPKCHPQAFTRLTLCASPLQLAQAAFVLSCERRRQCVTTRTSTTVVNYTSKSPPSRDEDANAQPAIVAIDHAMPPSTSGKMCVDAVS